MKGLLSGQSRLFIRIIAAVCSILPARAAPAEISYSTPSPGPVTIEMSASATDQDGRTTSVSGPQYATGNPGAVAPIGYDVIDDTRDSAETTVQAAYSYGDSGLTYNASGIVTAVLSQGQSVNAAITVELTLYFSLETSHVLAFDGTFDNAYAVLSVTRVHVRPNPVNRFENRLAVNDPAVAG
jgi:hypothetical protein